VSPAQQPTGVNVRRSLERRAAEQIMAGDRTMARVQVESRVDISGSGEVSVEIDFPVVYSAKPIFTFGGELDDNQTAEETNYPVISVMVVRWKTVERPEDRTFYVGATVAIVALGKENQRAIAHCLFEGLAFRDPTIGSGSLDGPI